MVLQPPGPNAASDVEEPRPDRARNEWAAQQAFAFRATIILIDAVDVGNDRVDTRAELAQANLFADRRNAGARAWTFARALALDVDIHQDGVAQNTLLGAHHFAITGDAGSDSDFHKVHTAHTCGRAHPCSGTAPYGRTDPQHDQHQ